MPVVVRLVEFYPSSLFQMQAYFALSAALKWRGRPRTTLPLLLDQSLISSGDRLGLRAHEAAHVCPRPTEMATPHAQRARLDSLVLITATDVCEQYTMPWTTNTAWINTILETVGISNTINAIIIIPL
jgi:hypothetical protein